MYVRYLTRGAGLEGGGQRVYPNNMGASQGLQGGGELSDAPSCFSYFDRGHVNMETLVQYFHNKL